MITIPDAVAFYWSDELNRAAVDALLADDEQPGDLTLDEVSALEGARLVAHRVQVEFLQLLHGVGTALFGTPVTMILSVIKDGSWEVGNGLAIEPAWTLSDDEWWIPATSEAAVNEGSSPTAIDVLQAMSRVTLEQVRAALAD